MCPFFLANLIAYNTSDSWEVEVPTVAGRIKKTVSDVQIDLLQSTLGSYNTSLDVVAFAPGALRMRVEFKVSSCPTCDTTSDGVHAFVVDNADVAFASYDDGALSLDHTFTLGSGSATLTVNVTPDESPPEAAHDLGSTEPCDDPAGHVLDASHSLSSDAQDDIALEFWWVDGDPRPHGHVMAPGSHPVALEVRDARGAAHRTSDQWVYVPTNCPS